MKKLIIIVLNLLIIQSISSAQTKSCIWKSNGNPKTFGLPLKINYPCGWEVLSGKKNNIVVKFIPQKTAYLDALLVSLAKLPEEPYVLDVIDFHKIKSLREMYENANCKIISHRLKTINETLASEVVLKSRITLNNELFNLYTMRYTIIAGDKLITIDYSVSAKENDKLYKYFNSKITFIRSLISKTKW